MKRLKLWHYVTIIALILVLCQLKLDKDQEPEPLFPSRGQVFLAKANRERVQYFSTHDKYVYSELSRREWEKVDWIPMGQWKYRAVITGNTTHLNERVTPLQSKTTCIIHVYNNCIEVNGITYLPPEGFGIIERLDVYWDQNAQNFNVYEID